MLTASGWCGFNVPDYRRVNVYALELVWIVFGGCGVCVNCWVGYLVGCLFVVLGLLGLLL